MPTDPGFARAQTRALRPQGSGLVLALLAVTSAACGHSPSSPATYYAPGGGSTEGSPAAYGEAQMANPSMSVAAVSDQEVLYASAPAPAPDPARRRSSEPTGKDDAAMQITPPALPPEEAQSVTASDAVQSGPLLVYSASFVLAVYEVEKTQSTLKQRAKELGGFISSQTDNQLTLRVPAGQFEAVLLAIEGAGKVRSRNVQAADVGDEYRDLTLRLHTAELLRQRLESMLAKAEKISDALEVQAQIERLVREIEQLKGHLRGLNDRIAYSTITIMFQPESRPDLDDSDVFKLPYSWLDELGLHHLLELAP
jgi:hypothetical protein